MRPTRLLHEGKYAAEVAIELVYRDESWSPTMSLDDARELDTVRLALRAATPPRRRGSRVCLN
jgi:hypothetical protein